LVGLPRQSVFGRLAGYEDVNDAERLRPSLSYGRTVIRPYGQAKKNGNLRPGGAEKWGLKTLAKAAADPDGWATGSGDGFGAMSGCAKLDRDSSRRGV
jgi:hypothetical protein